MNRFRNKNFKKAILIITLIINFLICSNNLQAVSLNNEKFPRLANIFLKTPITLSEAEQLANWDLVVLGMQAQDTDPEVFNILRSKNPDIIILAYVPSAEFPVSRLDILESPNGPWHQLFSGINSQWWLKDQWGGIVSFWPGNQSLNPSNAAPLINGERFNNYYAKFLSQTIMASGFWDGIFFDSLWAEAAWVNGGNLDLNLDGQKDGASYINNQWKSGMETIFTYLKNTHGQNIILLGNGGNEYNQYLNGRMFESFPNIWENGWSGQMQKYTNFMDDGQFPQISFLNGDTQNSGNWTNYADLRYSLASALLDNGFFSYDWGTADHSQLWWYDEYDVFLGPPLNDFYNLEIGQPLTITSGIWRRDYANGIVLVNSTNDSKIINLNGTFEKIRGSQDLLVNNGQLIEQVTLPGQDGLILLRTINAPYENQPNTSPTNGEITLKNFSNGAYARVFNQNGQNIRNGFFAYDSHYAGGLDIIYQDLNKDNQTEVIVVDFNKVKIYNQENQLIKEFFPYGNNFNKKINATIGDLNNDGWWEIIVVPAAGATTHIKTFSADGRLLTPGFFAYSQQFTGGADVAVADLDGDGNLEIMVAAGEGGGPHVQIFNRDGRLLTPGFFAFEPNSKMGLNIAAADVNGDGQGEIIVGRKKGTAEVRIFNKNGNLLNNWTGFISLSGVNVAVFDIDNNGISEIIALEQ